MKDMVPKRANNKTADPVGAVSESALQLRVWLGCAAPQRDRKSRAGEWVPASLSQPFQEGSGSVSCTAGSGYVIELAVWQNRSGCRVLSRMHRSTCIPWPPLPCDPELPRKLPRHQLFSELKKL